MSFLPSVECGKFKLKQAFQSGRILACTNKSEICAMHALLESNYAILTYILHFLTLYRGPKSGGMV